MTSTSFIRAFSRRTSSVGQRHCIWFRKIAMGKQTVESARLNLMLLNHRIINWAGLSHYKINFEQQTTLCLRECNRICMYVNIGTKVQINVFNFDVSVSDTDQQFMLKLHSDIQHLWQQFLYDWALRFHSQEALTTNVYKPPAN